MKTKNPVAIKIVIISRVVISNSLPCFLFNYLTGADGARAFVFLVQLTLYKGDPGL